MLLGYACAMVSDYDFVLSRIKGVLPLHEIEVAHDLSILRNTQ